MAEVRPWQTVVVVGLIAAGAAALISASWNFGRDRIAANERAKRLASLTSVLDTRHLGSDVNPVLIEVTDAKLLGTKDPVDVFVPLRGDKPLAAVFATIAPKGYNAPIALLVGIDADTGTVTGVRAIGYRETPGLGDRIDVRKSDWIRQFDGRSLASPDAAGWNVRPEGGDFDAITGATVTSKAVIEAVHDTLLYFAGNRDALFAKAVAAASNPEP